MPDAVLGMGFGHAEIGTVTPRPQEGNPRPRVFRLIRDRALINRLGFNNAGHAAALARLQARRPQGVVGVNVGANKDAADRAADYVAGVRAFYDVASYFTINVSSPNTPGLRDLQAPAALDDLVGARAAGARGDDGGRQAEAADRGEARARHRRGRSGADRQGAGGARRRRHRRVELDAGARRLGDTALAKEAGGISGRPLFHRSTVVLARVHVLTGGRIPLIGIGGIDSGATAIAKIEAGATLLQLYTGLVYEGPGLLARIKQELVAYVAREKLARVADVTGRRAEAWAAKAPEG